MAVCLIPKAINVWTRMSRHKGSKAEILAERSPNFLQAGPSDESTNPLEPVNNDAEGRIDNYNEYATSRTPLLARQERVTY